MSNARAVRAVLQAAEGAGVGTLRVLQLVAPQQVERVALLVALVALERLGARVPQQMDMEIAGVFELPAAVLADAGLGAGSIAVHNTLWLLIIDDFYMDQLSAHAHCVLLGLYFGRVLASSLCWLVGSGRHFSLCLSIVLGKG